MSIDTILTLYLFSPVIILLAVGLLILVGYFAHKINESIIGFVLSFIVLSFFLTPIGSSLIVFGYQYYLHSKLKKQKLNEFQNDINPMKILPRKSTSNVTIQNEKKVQDAIDFLASKGINVQIKNGNRYWLSPKDYIIGEERFLEYVQSMK